MVHHAGRGSISFDLGGERAVQSGRDLPGQSHRCGHAENGLLECKPSVAVWPELDGVGELPGQLCLEDLGPAGDQSGRLHPWRWQCQRQLFRKRRGPAVHRVAGNALLDDRQHPEPAPFLSGAAPGRTDLRRGYHGQHGRGNELPGHAPFAGAARRQPRRQRQLHLVALHWGLRGPEFRGSRYR